MQARCEFCGSVVNGGKCSQCGAPAPKRALPKIPDPVPVKDAKVVK